MQKTKQNLLIDRIRLCLVEAMNDSTDPTNFLDIASQKILVLVQDEKTYSRRS